MSESQSTRLACIIIEAVKGDRRAARGLIGRALKKVKVPYTRANYISESEMRICGTQDGRYTVEMTNEQAALFQKVAHEMALAEGWKSAPMDFYHD